MSYEDLKACFVGRQALLDELLDTLREQAEASTLQHWMILGGRGLGKTHLIRLFYLEIIRDQNLSRQWLPILMHEEEQAVFNLPTLFTRIIEMLAESLENQECLDAALSTSAFLDALKEKARGPAQLLDRATAYLKQFAKDQGRRLVVLLENADDLLTKCLPEEADVQKLRKILSLENFMLIIGASPTFFPHISKPKGVFYDFFRLRHLEPLSFQQAQELLQKWAHQEKDQARLSAVRNADYKLQVMYHLTGGNPRLLYFLYKAISNEASLENAAGTFEAMLEKDLSAYYLSRMRDIPNQVQPIVITMAKSENNLTQKEIAKESFLPERSLGTQMVRLEKEGVVKPVSGKKGKNTIYKLTDHLFRVWYQWRYPKQKRLIRGLVEFLAVWFSRRELEMMCGADGWAGQYYSEALAFKRCEAFKPHLEAILREGAATLREFAFKGEYIDAASILADIGEYAPDRREAFKKVIRESGLYDEPQNIEKIMQARIDADPGNSEDWFWLGRARLKQNEFAGAEAAFQKAVELKPDEAEAWLGLGLARGMIKNHAGAEAAFQKVVELKPDEAEAWLGLGLARGMIKNHAGAEAAFQKAVELKPDEAKAWLGLGEARFNQEDYGGAEAAFQKAVELKPDEAEAWLGLGRARFNQKDYGGAEAAAQKAVELEPDEAEAWRVLGLARIIQKDYGGAEAAFQKAVELKPDGAEAWLGLGAARFSQDDHAGAEAAFQKAVELEPDEAGSWLWLGRARFNQEDYAGAEAAFQKAVELKPDEAEAWLGLGAARFSQDDHAGAEAAFQKAVELEPDEAGSWLGLGAARFSQDDHAGAEAAFQKAVELKPDEAEAWLGLGAARFNQDDHAGAEAAFQKAVELKPDETKAWLWLGRARFNQKDYAGAEAAFLKAVELRPDEAEAWLELGRARYNQEDYAGAKAAFQKAVELRPDDPHGLNIYSGILFRSNRFKEAIEAQYRILKMDRFYTEAYFDLCLFNLLTGCNDTLFETMAKALRTKKAPSGFKTQIKLFFALVLAHEGEKKDFLKNLESGVKALEKMEDELRREILSDLSRFLVEAISPETWQSVKRYVDEFQKATQDTNVLSIVRPLTHVLEYAQAVITQKTGYASKQAQQALDRVPGELKGPVEEMAATVRKNLRWQSKLKRRG